MSVVPFYHSPHLAYPATPPIIVANVYQYPHAALEQRADVVSRRYVERVLRQVEALADVGAAGGEVCGHGGVDAEPSADVGSGEVVGDMSVDCAEGCECSEGGGSEGGTFETYTVTG